MDTVLFDSLREFVKPYYIDKGDLHNLEHVNRILALARYLARGENADDDLIVFGAYLHGLIFTDEAEIRNYLFSQELKRDRVIEVMKVAWEAGKEAAPETVEGACLHDAHLIEGGKEYQVAKWLISGAQQGQSLPQTLEYLETRVVGKYTVSTEKAQPIHKEVEKYRSHFIHSVHQALQGDVQNIPELQHNADSVAETSNKGTADASSSD